MTRTRTLSLLRSPALDAVRAAAEHALCRLGDAWRPRAPERSPSPRGADTKPELADAARTEPCRAGQALGDDRPTVVLLHSSAASSRQWDTLATSLRPAFEVHAVDLHGHGRQAAWAGERPLCAQDEAALVWPLIEGAGPVHLIGHSYGAAVALHLAAAHPERVRSLALFEPVLFSLLVEHDPEGAATHEVLALAEALRRLVMLGQLDVAAQDFLDHWSGGPAWQQLPPQLQRSATSRMVSVMQQFDMLFHEPLPRACWARLTMPVLCLSGDRSKASTLRIAGLLRALLPRARHETLAGVGHLGPITHPALVNARLLRFLAEELTPATVTAPAMA